MKFVVFRIVNDERLNSFTSHLVKSRGFLLKPFFLFFLFLSLISCNETDNAIDAGNGENELNITFGMDIKQSFRPAARTQTASETAVSEVKVLVFEGNKYVYTTPGKNISSSGNTVSFNAILRRTTSSTDVFVLANCNAIIAANPPVVGESKTAVAARITHSFSASGLSSSFPMFGAYSAPSGLNTLSHLNLNLSVMRDMARVDIDATDVIPFGNFTFVDARFYRINNRVQVIPNSCVSNVAVTYPSIPSSALNNVTTNSVPVSGSLSTAQLYVPEAMAPSSNPDAVAPCLIISGYYNGSTSLSYYRLDFDPQVAGHPFGQILRNYIYKFNIHGIYASGYSTPDDAANNAATNSSNYTVKVFDSNTTGMAFDASDYFGVSQNPAYVAAAINSTDTINVDTNVSSYTMQWADASGNPSGIADFSLDDGVISISQINSGQQLAIQAKTVNTSGVLLNRYVLFTANQLTFLLTINQGTLSVSPNPIHISASGGVGYALVNRSALWAPLSNQTWLNGSKAVAAASPDTLKWTATPSSTSARSGVVTVKALNGETLKVPFVQDAQNTTRLNITSFRSSGIYLGSGSDQTNADAVAKIIKGILVNTTNFGPAGMVNLAGFTITENATNPITAASIGNADILWLSYGGATGASAANVMSWLNGASNRVLIVICDGFYYDLLGLAGVTNAYQTSSATGNYPLQFNSNTAYFTTTGPFTSYPYKPVSSGFAYRRSDGNNYNIPPANNPQITPILLTTSGTIVLGIDKTRKIVYVCDGDIFRPVAGTGGTTDNYLQDYSGAASNSASKLCANIWAWVVQTALGHSPN